MSLVSPIHVFRHAAKKNPVQPVGRRFLVGLVLASFGVNTSSLAMQCNGKSDALGTSRVIAVDPKDHPRIGTMQYPETLPLADHEVVITFDDGPSPRYTDRVLEILASECVKATFFMVGRMAATFPDEARKVEADGHTVGTHSLSHPFTFGRMTESQAGQEIDGGIVAVGTALGNPEELAPFFRVPGLLTSERTEAAIASRGLMTWSADVPADDWLRISSAEIVKRAISRLEAKSRGILLLHDIHERTVEALPDLLSELKTRGYRVVQVVSANATIAKTATTPEQWRLPPARAVGAEENPAVADAPPSTTAPAKKAAALRRIEGSSSRLGGAKGF
ncbi:polysaccharide deacetylase family protein [Bradyrhizobium commune]|nr:polysaccharide deacetylase family protein [Bradyrhizobium commune]